MKNKHYGLLICFLLGCVESEEVEHKNTCDLEECLTINSKKNAQICTTTHIIKMNLEKKCIEDSMPIACGNDIIYNISNGLEFPGPYLLESPTGECWYGPNASFPKGWRQITAKNPPTSICEPYLNYFYYEHIHPCRQYYPDDYPPKDLTSGEVP